MVSWLFPQWAAVPQSYAQAESSSERELEQRDLVMLHHPAEGSQRPVRGYGKAAILGVSAVLACGLLLRHPMHHVAHKSKAAFDEFFSIGPIHFFEWETSTTTTTTVTSTTSSSTTGTTSSTSSTSVTSTTSTTTRLEYLLSLPGEVCDFEFALASTHSPAARCFCQLANNSGCHQQPCMCPQGCHGNAWHHPRSVTFVNKAKAHDCHNKVETALLTIPRSYMRDISYLKFWCPRGALSLLTEMLREGFLSYQREIKKGPVRQCIHAGVIASVPWLHLHTIGIGGFVDNMFHNTNVIFCHNLFKVEDAEENSWQMLKWTGGNTMGKLKTLPLQPPSTCATMGCGTWGPKHHCSCDPSCRKLGICCKDYQEKCFSTCHQIGCGNAPRGNMCKCDADCKEYNNCCHDAQHTCQALWTTRTATTTGATTTTGQSLRHGLATRNASANSSGVPKVDSCMELGCGASARPIHATCSCSESCGENENCCLDFLAVCNTVVLKKKRRILSTPSLRA